MMVFTLNKSVETCWPGHPKSSGLSYGQCPTECLQCVGASKVGAKVSYCKQNALHWQCQEMQLRVNVFITVCC